MKIHMQGSVLKAFKFPTDEWAFMKDGAYALDGNRVVLVKVDGEIEAEKPFTIPADVLSQIMATYSPNFDFEATIDGEMITVKHPIKPRIMRRTASIGEVGEEFEKVSEVLASIKEDTSYAEIHVEGKEFKRVLSDLSKLRTFAENVTLLMGKQGAKVVCKGDRVAYENTISYASGEEREVKVRLKHLLWLKPLIGSGDFVVIRLKNEKPLHVVVLEDGKEIAEALITPIVD